MPGMMDTVLNLGMTDAVVEAVAKKVSLVFSVRKQLALAKKNCSSS
jgi:phosphoenolpyruvate synthase/pyruvate phosphate dikinase